MKLLPLDLASMLEFGGFIHPDPNDEMMCRIGYFADLINAHIERPEPQADQPKVEPGPLTDEQIDAARAEFKRYGRGETTALESLREIASILKAAQADQPTGERNE